MVRYLLAEVCALDVFVRQKLRAGAAQADAAGLKDISIIRDLKRHVRVLLYQKHGNTALVYLAYNVKYSLDYQRREAKRRFVHHNKHCYLRIVRRCKTDKRRNIFSIVIFSFLKQLAKIHIIKYEIPKSRILKRIPYK